MQTDTPSRDRDLDAVLRFLDATKSNPSDGGSLGDVLSAIAENLSKALFVQEGDELAFVSGDFEYGGFDEQFKSDQGGYVIAEVSNPEVPLPLYVVVDRRSMDAFIDLKFGGDGTRLPVRDTHSFSTIDRSIAALLFEHIAEALTNTLSTFPWRTAKFTENFMSTSIAELPHDEKSYSHLKFQLENEEIELAFVISFPTDLVDLFRAEADPGPNEQESQAKDLDWARHVENEIMESRIGLRALVVKQEFSISEIDKMAVGEVLPINAKADDRLPIVSDDSVLFFSSIGQLNGAYAMRVVDVLEPIRKFSTSL